MKECGWFHLDGDICGGFNCCEFVGDACEFFPLIHIPKWAEDAGLDGYDLYKDKFMQREANGEFDQREPEYERGY